MRQILFVQIVQNQHIAVFLEVLCQTISLWSAVECWFAVRMSGNEQDYKKWA